MMRSGGKILMLLLFLFVFVFIGNTEANSQWEISHKKRGSHDKVSVLTVALFTLVMVAATGLGAVSFFFVELDPQWVGICNGMAAGVMLAASFDLVKKGMLDIKGADAAKVVHVVGIMKLHSFGKGSGVGVSFAGAKGFSQGLLVTLAIAVHNIPEGLAVSMVLASRGVSPQNAMLWSIITSLPQPIIAVPAFLCADAISKFLPFCTGFVAGCMIWMVIAEVLPDAFKGKLHVVDLHYLRKMT
ncbi:hypothetical protein Bca4012_066269 [Brassica carinata]